MATNPFAIERKKNPFDINAKNNPFDIEKEKNPFDIEKPSSSGEAFSVAANKKVGNLALAVPSAAGQVVAQGLAGTSAAIQGGISAATGGEFDFNRRANEEMQGFPNKQLNSIPSLNVNQIGAAVQSIPGLFGKEPIGDRYNRELDQYNAEDESLRQQHPTASTGGDIFGEIMSLVGGRDVTGAANKMKSFEQFVMKSKNKLDNIKPGPLNFLNERLVNAKGWRSLVKGAGRSAEAGLEAVTLDLLNGNEPTNTAAYAVALQSGESLSLSTLKHMLSGPKMSVVGKLGIAAGLGTVAWKFGQETIPGGPNSTEQAIAKGFGEVVLLVAAGTLAGIMGGGRLRGGGGDLAGLEENMPRIADALSSIPRGTIMALIRDMQEAPPPLQKVTEQVLQQLSTEPESFSDEQVSRLEAAFNDLNFTETIDDMMSNDEEFAMRMLTIITDQEQEAKKQSQLGPLPPDFGAQ